MSFEGHVKIWQQINSLWIITAKEKNTSADLHYTIYLTKEERERETEKMGERGERGLGILQRSLQRTKDVVVS